MKKVMKGDIEPPKKEAIFVYCIETKKIKLNDAKKFIEFLEEYSYKHESELSVPLYLNLKFLIEYIKNNPDVFHKLIEVLN